MVKYPAGRPPLSDNTQPQVVGTQSRTPSPDGGRARPGGFRLLRYFTVATLVAFAAVGMTLVVMEDLEAKFFDQAQRSQQETFLRAQADLSHQNEQAVRASLLAVQEAGHVMLTRVVANLLWASDIAPFVVRAQRVAIDHCRTPTSGGAATPAPGERKSCFAQVGQSIVALPGFAMLNRKAYEAMRATRVFKIKVWDLRGITIYSSEHRQIGEDGSANRGWLSAVAGTPASELTHRDRFSAFEGVVENRDLISTYVPVRDPATKKVAAVVELYSDVTPFLEQSRAASLRFAEISKANQTRIEDAGRSNLAQVKAESDHFLLIIGGLLALLYFVSLLIVGNGQRIIDRQIKAQELAAQREDLWHREKMAALSAMAANVAHEVGNPLAVISGLAQYFPDTPAVGGQPGLQSSTLIVQQTDRIARMMRQLTEFASASSDRAEWIDVNAMLKVVCEFFSFDPRFQRISIVFQPDEQLPAVELVPDHLNEVMMNLLQVCATDAGKAPQANRIDIRSGVRDGHLLIGVYWRSETMSEPPAEIRSDARFDQVVRRVSTLLGRIEFNNGGVELLLPLTAQATAVA